MYFCTLFRGVFYHPKHPASNGVAVSITATEATAAATATTTTTTTTAVVVVMVVVRLRNCSRSHFAAIAVQ